MIPIGLDICDNFGLFGRLSTGLTIFNTGFGVVLGLLLMLLLPELAEVLRGQIVS